jgi:hypothetical protein
MLRILLALALLAAPGLAEAHARLKSATPAPGDMIDAPPTEVSITFSEGLEPKLSSIVVQDEQGHEVQAGAAFGGADAKVLVVKLKPLSPGNYKVIWHATSVDTHKTEGSFGFMLH